MNPWPGPIRSSRITEKKPLIVIMRAYKYLIALWVTVAVYGIFSAFAGAMGFSAYRELLMERDRQRANLELLGHINVDLENTKNSLLYDRDTIAVYARELGYGRTDERFIRIVGLGEIQNSPPVPGEVVRARQPGFIADGTLKFAALCAGIAVCAFFLIYDLFNRRNP
jgi:cell division protein FtsB